jgi:hypothetical protein
MSIAVIKRTKYRLSLIITMSEKAFTTLIGRNWLDVIIPDWRDIFISVFDEVNIGQFRRTHISIKLQVESILMLNSTLRRKTEKINDILFCACALLFKI